MAGAAVIIAVFWLIILYNSTVALEHGISGMRAELKSIQAANAELKETLLSLFDASTFGKIIDGTLVKDKNPEYIKVSQKWSFASSY